MGPIYKKCLIAIEKINEQVLPAMGQSYKQFISDAKVVVMTNQCLNESRKFSKAAIEALNTNDIDNRNVKNYLERLQDIDVKINQKSRYLNDLLNGIRTKFVNRSKSLAQKNYAYLNEMKTGNTPAEELLQKIVALGKEIQKVTNEEIPGYKRELDAYMKKAENDICNDAYNYYNKIVKLDKGTFPAIRTREWTHLPDEFLRTSGAFVNTDYDKVD